MNMSSKNMFIPSEQVGPESPRGHWHWKLVTWLLQAAPSAQESGWQASSVHWVTPRPLTDKLIKSYTWLLIC